MEKERVIVSFDIGIKNLACCVLRICDKSDTTIDVIHWEIISLAAVKEKIPNVQELSMRLFAEMDDLTDTLEKHGITHITDVLIENQPSRLNGVMKSVQMMIYSYFQLRKYWEGRVGATHLISASGKLKDHDHTVDVRDVDKTGYELNKWKSVKITEMYITNDTGLQEKLCSYKKKDDICDALLQAIAWLRKQKYDIQHARLCV